MKKIIFLIYFFSSIAVMAFGQDLISSTRNGTAYQQAKSEPNTIAKLIEDRKRQKAIFQNLEILEFDLSKQTKEYENIVSDAIFLELNQIGLAKFLSSPARDITFNIPVARGKNIILELTHVNIVSEGFSVVTSSGKEAFHSPTGIFYQGIVKGDFNSLAVVSIFRNHIRILISDIGGSYLLGELSGKSPNHILFNERNLLAKEDNWTCETPDYPLPQPSKKQESSKVTPLRAVGGCVKVYVETEFQVYLDRGSNFINVVDYILGIFNEVIIAYANIDVNMEVSQIFIWDQNDPYSDEADETDTGPILDEFINTRTTFNGNIAHLITTRPMGGLAAGIGAICGSNPHCISGGLSSVDPSMLPTTSSNFVRVAHEMGHILGSQHTHACVWGDNDNEQIDDCGNVWATTNMDDDDDDGTIDELDEAEGNDCFDEMNPILPMNGGTIMSYCNQISFRDLNNGFGNQPAGDIRNTVINASCLQAQCSCEEFTDRTVNGMPIPSAVYTASNSITSSGDADATEDNIVIFQAGRRIELTPDFEATNFFVAQIVDTLCANNDGSIISIPSELQLITNNQVSENLKLYPNPAFTDIQLVYNLVGDGKVSIYFTNQYGQLTKILEDKTFQQKGDYNRQIQLDDLPAGVYYITLQTSRERLVKSFIIARL